MINNDMQKQLAMKNRIYSTKVKKKKKGKKEETLK